MTNNKIPAGKHIKKLSMIMAVLGIVSLGILAGCTDMLTPPLQEGAEGTGRALVRIGPQVEGARTLMPADTGAVSYELTFSPISGDSDERTFPVTGNAVTVDLAPGIWDLSVTGYCSDIPTLAGSANGISIQSGETTEIPPIEMKMIQTYPGNGTLRYSVTFPDAVTFGQLFVLRWVNRGFSLGEDSVAKVKLLDSPASGAGTITASGDLPLSGGYYRLAIVLQTADKELVRADIAHIYPGQITAMEGPDYTFDLDDFAANGSGGDKGYDPTGTWDFAIMEANATVTIIEGYWNFDAPGEDYDASGTFSQRGNIGTLYSDSLGATIGTAELIDATTMILRLVEPSYFTGELTGTKSAGGGYEGGEDFPPEKDPGIDPRPDPGKDPGTDPGTDPGKDPGKDPGTDGTITFTGIDPIYEGQYATFRSSGSTPPQGGEYLVGTTDPYMIEGVQIRNGSVTIPVWLVEDVASQSVRPYTGNDTGIRIYLIIQYDPSFVVDAVFSGGSQYTIEGVDFFSGGFTSVNVNSGSGGGFDDRPTLPEARGKLILTDFNDFNGQYVFTSLCTASGKSLFGTNRVEFTGPDEGNISLVQISGGYAEIPLYDISADGTAIFPYEGSEPFQDVSVMIGNDDDGWLTAIDNEAFFMTAMGINSNPSNSSFTPSTSGGNITISRSDVKTMDEIQAAMMGGDYTIMQTVKYILTAMSSQ